MDIRGFGAIVPENFQWYVKLMMFSMARQIIDQVGNRFGLFPPLRETPSYDAPSKLTRAAAKAQARKSALSRRALIDLELWIDGEPPAVAAE